MAVMRCPAHDVLIETETDHKAPGKGEPDPVRGGLKLSTHPRGANGLWCHPDCTVGKKERAAAKASPQGTAGATRRIA